MSIHQVHSGNSSGAQQIKGKTFAVTATQCPLSLLLIAYLPTLNLFQVQLKL